MPSQTFTHTAFTPASPVEVWAALDRPATWEGISGIDRVTDSTRDESGTLTGFSFETTIGGRPYRGMAVPGERVEGSRLVWLIQSPDVGGSIGVALAPAGDGTDLTVDLTVAVDGFLASLFFPAITQALGRGFPEAVGEFAASFGHV